jgi:hypothetical protein
MHAIAIISLAESEGQVFGRISEPGADAIAGILSVPVHGTNSHQRQGIAAVNTEMISTMVEGFGDKMDWTNKMIVLGKLTADEQRTLKTATGNQIDIVQAWLLNLLTGVMMENIITMAPPIYSRIFQEISNGMWGYLQALRIVVIPMPEIITVMSNGLILYSFCILPFAVENSVQSKILTPLLTFLISWCYLLIHIITNMLEVPYGDDYIDLPLLEMQYNFNSKLMAGNPLDTEAQRRHSFDGDSEGGNMIIRSMRVLDTLPSSQRVPTLLNGSSEGAGDRVRSDTDLVETSEEETETEEDDSDKVPTVPTLPDFISSILAEHESESKIKDFVRKCEDQKITFESLTQSHEQKCLFDLLDQLGLTLGLRVLLMKGVANLKTRQKEFGKPNGVGAFMGFPKDGP